MPESASVADLSVSVLIVNFFCAHLTARAVASIYNDLAGAEVVVVDNSHDPGEAAKLARCLDPRCRLIVAERNLGFGVANERALAASSGRHVMLLNPDAVLAPGCLERLAATLKANPQAGIVAPRAWWDAAQQFALPVGLMESPTRELMREIAARWPLAGRLLSWRTRQSAIRVWRTRTPLAVEMISGAALMMRRSDIPRFGPLFDPRFFMFYEDTDLCRRVREARFKLLLEPAAHVVHTWRLDPHKGPLMADGRSRYLAKHFPNSRIRPWVERLRQRPGQALPAFDFEDLGCLERPPVLTISAVMASDWLLEVSPSPLFVPAAGRFGQGQAVHFENDWFDNLAPGRYFARLAPTSGGATQFWTWTCSGRMHPEDDLSRLNGTFDRSPGERDRLPDCTASAALLRRFGLERCPDNGNALVKFRQPTWRTAWFAPESMDAALSLFQAAFNKPMDARMWQWKYQGQAKRGIGVWREQKLVAFFGWAPRHVLFFGAPMSAVQCCDVMTDPEERGMLSREGPFFSATLTFAECALSRREGHRLAFGFPSYRHFLLGQRLGVYFELDKLLELRWQCAPGPASLRYRIRPWQGTNTEARQLESCWREMAASLAEFVLPVRDPDFLHYRYRQHPLFLYDCLLVSHRWVPTAIGLVVLRRHDDWVELIDVVADRKHLATLVSAARRFTARIGKRELRGWIAAGCAGLLASPDCETVDTGITIPLARDPALADVSRGRWFLMAGDSDFH